MYMYMCKYFTAKSWL